MGNKTAFSQEDLNSIFKVSPHSPTRIISRESGDLEFKQSFGWSSLTKYLKTCAAYANVKGGYIVFGIANRPHILVGLSGATLQAFENIDPQKLTGHFNDYFSPEIGWDIDKYEFNGKTYGLLYVYESSEKPVVCKKDADRELKEGDIYYRYRGRSERIKYPELRNILDQRRAEEQKLWMKHLSQISRIGVQDTAIFDLQTGHVAGTNSSFLIDESLLSQLSFIRDGEFSEIEGKPTLKLIGNVEPIYDLPHMTGKKEIIKTKGIRISDIVLDFLTHKNIREPLEYIKQICFESTAFLPVYFFMNRAKCDRDATIEMVEGVMSRSKAKARLLERLRLMKTQQVALHDNKSDISSKKQKYARLLRKQKLVHELEIEELGYCLQALRSLSPNDVKKNSGYLRDLLKVCFNKYYTSVGGGLADNLRRSICWVDEALYMKVE